MDENIRIHNSFLDFFDKFIETLEEDELIALAQQGEDYAQRMRKLKDLQEEKQEGGKGDSQ